jgi:hypothetical protein
LTGAVGVPPSPTDAAGTSFPGTGEDPRKGSPDVTVPVPGTVWGTPASGPREVPESTAARTAGCIDVRAGGPNPATVVGATPVDTTLGDTPAAALAVAEAIEAAGARATVGAATWPTPIWEAPLAPEDPADPFEAGACATWSTGLDAGATSDPLEPFEEEGEPISSKISSSGSLMTRVKDGDSSTSVVWLTTTRRSAAD